MLYLCRKFPEKKERIIEMFPEIKEKLLFHPYWAAQRATNGAAAFAEETGLKKYYFIDNGMRQNILLPHSQDNGKLLESSVLLHLCRMCGELEKVTYFMNERECDFVLQHEDQVLQLIQVCWQMDDAETISPLSPTIRKRPLSVTAWPSTWCQRGNGCLNNRICF